MLKINVRTNVENYLNDFEESFRAFTPDVEISGEGDVFYIGLSVDENGKSGLVTVKTAEKYNNIYEKQVNLEQFKHLHEKKAELKRIAKVFIYDYVSSALDKKLPYGALTGIRPTKLYCDTEKSGRDAYSYFTNDMRVSRRKADFIREITTVQKPFRQVEKDEIDVFVNVPICVSRCSYCSFISAEYGRIKKIIPAYRDAVLSEIDAAKRVVSQKGLKVRAVYVGGGTPTSLDDEDFDAIVAACAGFGSREFTIEAGRPDTLTLKKAEIMRRAGAGRVSVNPQTFNQRTLDAIGRNHTVAQIYEAFEICRGAGFQINTDLIAMLPDEAFSDFKRSLDCALELEPENITVHTLAIKAGSRLKEGNFTFSGDASEMVDYAAEAVKKAGYRPYYMYRQKYMSGALENAGYAKKGFECVYNIDIMEEIASILAIGAGAISKRVFPAENRIERLANPKAIEVYNDRIEEIIAKKLAFFE